ncbi:MAG: phosphoglucosamine mutase [bacterium]|nr:phosphoglucosamine mutase [bacterium]
MKRKLFGTDGMRGRANTEPLTGETLVRLGRAIVAVFKESSHRANKSHRPKILVGKDTRVSGYMLETALASGICSMGGNVLLVGPLPTPGIAYLTSGMRADAGVVISASHNLFEDNGIKIFSGSGFKLPDEMEARIEELIASKKLDGLLPRGAEVGRALRIEDAEGRYIVYLKQTFPRNLTLEGLRVVVDCAHGAAYQVAPAVLEELGAEVFAIGVEPNGENINLNCGSIHPEAMSRQVVLKGAQVGVALDGDGDRCILADEKGRIHDGDEVMAALARDLLQEGKLQKQTLVATVMSNQGLDLALKPYGGKVVRTNVGDRYVVEEMIRGGYNLGGEQSGHIAFLDHSTTGDGMITALQVLALVQKTGKPLSELLADFKRLPQVLLNIEVKEKVDLAKLPKVTQAIDKISRELGESGRVLVRYSGTEPKARVMIEGEEETRIRAQAEEIAAVIRKEIGV